MDKSCPNAGYHGPKHIESLQFLRLLRDQLATDRGADADSMPLYLAGAVGSLFKLRLSAYGYTLVAKGVEAPNLSVLKHEKQIYGRLRAIQGKCVPVCLGLIDLVLPYDHDGGVFTYFLLLSWAGRPLLESISQIDKTPAKTAIAAAFTRLHQLWVLHGDAELRNISYDATSEGFLVIDFEHAQVHDSQPLGSISPNSQH